jgi:signal transduction histidine kinase
MLCVRSLRLQHTRLALWFLLVTALGLAAGASILALRGEAGNRGAGFAVAAAALVTGVTGFGGVLFHRLRVLHQKFAETEAYLAAIESESAKYRALLEGAADVVVVLDAATGARVESNARARELLGTEGDLLAQAVDEDAHLLRDAVKRAASAAGSVESIPRVRVRSAGGAVLDCEARIASVELADRRVVHLALRDRTRERAIERELAVRERLASLGLLTAGVAHEINNPLEGIGNHVNLLARPGLAPEERARHLEMVRHGLERVRDLVRDLLRFARPASTRDRVDLREVFERARRLAAYSRAFREVEVVTTGFDAPVVVLGDPGRLEQVLLNLLLNASNAMQGRGRILVDARRDAPGGALVTVADEGPGIPPADLDRIFDPFFTTGGGTGLGLSIAFGILQAHGGSLSARNRPEGGAEFVLGFPDPAAAAPEESDGA